MNIMILYLLFCSNKSFLASCTTTSASLNITDEKLFRQMNPNVKIVDIGIKKKICPGGNCHPEEPLGDAKLERFRAYARFMTAGYCRSVLIDNWKCGTCIDSSSPVKNTTDALAFHAKYHTVHGLLAVSHDLQRVFVVFQGVQHKIQWVISSRGFFPGKLNTKFSNQSVPPHNIKVHRGFQHSWLNVRPLFMDELIQRIKKYPDYKLVIMGHSFGAGIAAIMACHVAIGTLGPNFKVSDTELVTFGSSRVGNKDFAQTIDKAGFLDVARIVHSTDILAHIPFWPLSKFMLNLLQDYQHYKGEIWLSSVSKRWVTCDDRNTDNPGEAKNCANSIRGRFSIATHTSYWSRTKEYFCPIHMSLKPLEIIYLPTFGLVKY